MELVNECYAPARARSAATTLRFATATAASLIFPFAPHCGADVYERLTGAARLGGAVAGGRPGAAGARRGRDRRCRSTASCATGCRRRRAPTREELETLARDRPRVQAHLDGKDVVKVIVVPVKLVNFVVR